MFAMPTINRLKKKERTSDKSNLRKKLYSDRLYQKIRKLYFMEHPLCEECLKEGKTVQARDVHHKQSPFNDNLSMVERYALLRNPNNFISLCRDCHQKAHGNIKKKNWKKISENQVILKSMWYLYIKGRYNESIWWL